MRRQLYRSRRNKVIAGVCGGVAEYFSIDPTLVRIALIISTMMFEGWGIWGYIIAVLVIPKNEAGTGEPYKKKSVFSNQSEFEGHQSEWEQEDWEETGWKESGKLDATKGRTILGTILILLGVLYLLKQFFDIIHLHIMGPVLLVAIGAALILKGWRK